MARPRRTPPLPVLIGLLAVLPIVAALAIAAGSVPLAPRTVAAVLLRAAGVPIEPTWPPEAATIILALRLPRVALAALVGLGLAGAGVVFQGIFRNPLADPYLIGVSAGAALGATVAIVRGAEAGLGGLGAVGAVPVAAFLGALAVSYGVYRLARRGTDVPVEDLLLAGIAVGAFLAAVISLLQLAGGESLQRVIFWVMGGFAGRTWAHIALAAPYALGGLALAWLYGRDLNVLQVGEEGALQLGVDVPRVKRILLVCGSLMAAAAVATSGLIGFVGLVVPHLMRLVVGPDHRVLLPAAALAGAVILILADLIARTAITPAEIPVGVVTALLGAPFFLYLLLRGRRAPAR
ncbi:MAG: iron chelate uptake ABC transporter family permease subunit [Armatimonadetes bacterium]|nr:iron chelate uptake ABC transporter family permease subunit [Armatimonadota bacterium]